MNRKAFIDYAYSFYGAGGIYDMGATRTELSLALDLRLLNFPHIPFDAPNGDTTDRELVRDILIAAREANGEDARSPFYNKRDVAAINDFNSCMGEMYRDC